MSALTLTSPAARSALIERAPSIRALAAAAAPWLVETTFPVFGLGPVVDIGCADTTLSREFASRGIPTSIVDLTGGASVGGVAEPIEVVFLVHVLEWLAADDLGPFLTEVRRAVGRDLFVVVDTRAGGWA